MLKMPASLRRPSFVKRKTYLVRRNEPIAYDLWQESQLELPKLLADTFSRQTALFLSHQLYAIRSSLLLTAMTQSSTMARRGSGPPFIWLPADNSPMTPQVLSPLTQSTTAAYRSPQWPRFQQPRKRGPSLRMSGSPGFTSVFGWPD